MMNANQNSPERAARMMRTPLQGLILTHFFVGLRPTLKRFALSGLFLLLTLPARAGVAEAWVEVSNARPYVGEAFTFTLRVAVTPGSDLANVNIHNLDRYPLAFGTLRGTGRVAGAGGNEVLSYTGVFRATAPFAPRVELLISGEISEQRRGGFFTQWTRSPFSANVKPLNFEARALPVEGRPPAFSGAVGRFTLDVQSAPLEVRVDSLVTREIRLQGAPDNLPGTLMPEIPGLGEHFKANPPWEVSRAENPPALHLRQQLVPLNTNAQEIVSPSFTFFDPAAGAYRTLQPPPEKLVFLAAEENARDPGRRIIEFDLPENGAVKTAPAPGFALPSLRGAGEQIKIEHPTPARLAPSNRAVVLFELEPGASVIITERTEGWLRVVSNNRAGWIHELGTRNTNHDNP